MIYTLKRIAILALAALSLHAGAAPSGIVEKLFLQAGAGAVPRATFDKLKDSVSVYDFMTAAQVVDAKSGSPTVETTAAIQAAINAARRVHVPADGTFLVNTLSVPSNRTIVVDGTLKRIANAPASSYMFVNASGAAGDMNIVLTGLGELDGNASNQTNDMQGLVRFQKPTDCDFSVRKAGNNRYTSTNPTTSGQGSIVLIDSTRCKVHDVFLNLWQREGIYLDGATMYGSVRHIVAVGDGLNSWSAVSISGAGAIGNSIDDVQVDNAGATSVVLDSTYSQASNVISRNNTYNNGMNFGHTGKPASFSRANNITVYNAGRLATSGNTHNGISIAGGTTDFELSNATVDTAYSNAVNVSDSATRITIGGKNRFVNAKHGSGLYTFGANFVRAAGIVATGNSDYGVNFATGDDCSIVDSHLAGNTLNGFSATGSRITIRSTPLSNDPVAGTINLNAGGDLTAGQQIVVTNKNVSGFYSSIKLFPRDAQTAQAQAYLVNQGNGTFTVGFVNAVSSVGAPHNLSYEFQ